MDAAMRLCIVLSRRCEAVCIESARHCLDKGGRHAETSYINLLLAGAETCRTSAQLLLLRSEFHVLMCAVCADVCEACADDTESKGTDPILKRCIDTWRKCAAACREMAGTPAFPGFRSPRPSSVKAAAGEVDPGTRRPMSGRARGQLRTHA